MKKIIPFVILTFVLIQCKNSTENENLSIRPSQDELKKSIKVMDDSLKVLYQELMKDPQKQVPSLAIYETINRYLAFYKNYPTDKYSANCLDKVQQLYQQEKIYENSLAYTDTLLLKFPDYKEKANLLLNAGSTAELMNDMDLLKKYYQRLLEECKDLNSETRKMVEFRLKHIDKSFDELIEMQMKAISKK
jgi:tetratricopeptide (TPR) repeat protein